MTKSSNQLDANLWRLIHVINDIGWFSNGNAENFFVFDDGTEVLAKVEEILDIPLFLENYDEMNSGKLEKLNEIKFDSDEIETEIDHHGNMLHFIFVFSMPLVETSSCASDSPVEAFSLRYLQLGDGVECGYRVDLANTFDELFLNEWALTTIKNGKSVVQINGEEIS